LIGILCAVRCDGVGPQQAPQEPPVDSWSEADQVRIGTCKPYPARDTVGPSTSCTQPLDHRSENRPRHVLAEVETTDLIE